MAISILENTTDAISRQAAIDAIQKLNIPEDMCVFEIISHIEVEIATLPSAQPKRGKWIHQAKFGRIECDQCGKVYRNAFAPKNFCPNCGADMRGEAE